MSGVDAPRQSRPSASLRRATPLDAQTVATWSRSEEETLQWCSSPTHPVPAERIVAWWDDLDVQPWVLISAGESLLGYGELWLDSDEDEVELARIIVAPEARGYGWGQQLVHALHAQAAATALSAIIVRVAPDNAAAIHCYLASGFVRVGAAEAAQWNAGQPQNYVWMTANPQGGEPVSAH